MDQIIYRKEHLICIIIVIRNQNAECFCQSCLTLSPPSFLRTCYMLGTVVAVRDIEVNKSGVIYATVDFIFIAVGDGN